MGQEPATFEARATERPRRRLTPAMASFRLLVLDFGREYLTLHGASPSYGEIAAGLDHNREMVRKAVRSLVRDRLLLQGDRPRSLAMPDVEDEAIRALLGLGYRIDEKARVLRQPVTDPPLLPPASLTYPPLVEGEKEHGADGQGEAGKRA